MPNTFDDYLAADAFFDHDHPAVNALAEELTRDVDEPIEQAVALYRFVRDEINYNAYTFKAEPHTFSASYCLQQGESYCIPKAVLLGALCRAKGIPARLGLADVRNHLASPQFLEYLQSDVFVMHGYIDLYLNGKWVKATPAFDRRLCRLMKVAPLEFDGRKDSIFHEFNDSGEQHMEYLADHGVFASVPHQQILDAVRAAYPHLSGDQQNKTAGRSLHDDMQAQPSAD